MFAPRPPPPRFPRARRTQQYARALELFAMETASMADAEYTCGCECESSCDALYEVWVEDYDCFVGPWIDSDGDVYSHTSTTTSSSSSKTGGDDDDSGSGGSKKKGDDDDGSGSSKKTGDDDDGSGESSSSGSGHKWSKGSSSSSSSGSWSKSSGGGGGAR